MGKRIHQHESALAMLFPWGGWEVQQEGLRGGGATVCLVPTQQI